MMVGAVSVLRSDPRLELVRASAISSALDVAGRAALRAILSAILGRLEGLRDAPGDSSPASSSKPNEGRVGDARGLGAYAGAAASETWLSSW